VSCSGLSLLCAFPIFKNNNKLLKKKKKREKKERNEKEKKKYIKINWILAKPRKKNQFHSE
jgi:hypothetical protein